MRYEKIYFARLKVWEIWETRGNTSELIKRFKTEQAADRWLARKR